MKKIGLFGSFGSSSIGDEAILKGIVNILLHHNNGHNLVIFTENIEITRSALAIKSEKIEYRNIYRTQTSTSSGSSKRKKSLKVKKIIYKILYKRPSLSLYLEDGLRRFLKKPLFNTKTNDLDMLIFAGGNIFMDKFVRWPLIMNTMVKEVHCPIYFLGVGAGPINHLYTKNKIKKILENYYVSTRDEDSLLLLKDLGKNIKELKLSNDLAFGLNSKNKEKLANTSYFTVSLIPYNHPDYWPNSDIEKYENYIQNMANIILFIAEKTKMSPLFIATNHPTDLAPAQEVVNRIKVGNVITQRNNVNELIEYLNNSKFTIGTRLHSLILSSVAGNNIIGIGYQPKVKYFMKRHGLLNNYIEMKTLEDDILNEVSIKNIISRVDLEQKVEVAPIKRFLIKEVMQIINEEFK